MTRYLNEMRNRDRLKREELDKKYKEETKEPVEENSDLQKIKEEKVLRMADNEQKNSKNKEQITSPKSQSSIEKEINEQIDLIVRESD